MTTARPVGVFCFGSAGDVLPFARLAHKLAQTRRTVLFAHSRYEPMMAKLDVEYFAYDTLDQYHQLLADASWLNSPTTIPKFLRQHVFPRSDKMLALFEETLQPGDRLIAPPLFDIVPRIAAEKLDLRLLSAFLAPAQVELSALRTLMFEKVLAPDVNNIREQHHLAEVVDWHDWLSYSDPSLGLWPSWFASDDGWRQGLTPTGFFLDQHASKNLPSEVEAYLATNSKPILLTAGTGAFLDKKFYGPCIEAISGAGLPAIVVTRYPQQLPSPLPNQLLVVEQLPFEQLIPKTSLVIHHGGIGTTAETLRAGKPQLILAHGADRPDNGARVEALGAGRCLAPARWTATNIADQISHLLHSQAVHTRCIELAQKTEHELSSSKQSWLVALN